MFVNSAFVQVYVKFDVLLHVKVMSGIMGA